MTTAPECESTAGIRKPRFWKPQTCSSGPVVEWGNSPMTCHPTQLTQSLRRWCPEEGAAPPTFTASAQRADGLRAKVQAILGPLRHALLIRPRSASWSDTLGHASFSPLARGHGSETRPRDTVDGLFIISKNRSCKARTSPPPQGGTPKVSKSVCRDLNVGRGCCKPYTLMRNGLPAEVPDDAHNRSGGICDRGLTRD